MEQNERGLEFIGKTDDPVLQSGGTAPYDPRFPNQNQTKHCWYNYVQYHLCAYEYGHRAPQCFKFFNNYNSLCPTDWVEEWDDQREEKIFPGLPEKLQAPGTPLYGLYETDRWNEYKELFKDETLMEKYSKYYKYGVFNPNDGMFDQKDYPKEEIESLQNLIDDLTSDGVGLVSLGVTIPGKEEELKAANNIKYTFARQVFE
eukprot:TRINITY_DN587_c0_g1_i1.p1 TRINITY_DN587_c0_g1~~TRINITY_DN587_c0_g1_i1.p1  ORF type:complete len:219 (-),score=42.30 TRINITY_DN587_c0_g1_i1:53-658(-)